MIRLQADRVTFYYDRFLVEADGNVRVTSGSTQISGDAFSMDLKLNRFVVAGRVNVRSPLGEQNGAALADFFDFNRIYFVPLSTEPDRWTFENGDFAHPLKGREMPGDTFALPDLSNDSPFLVSKNAVIATQNYVRFGSGSVDIAGGVHAYIPVPSYYINFSANQHLGENSLSGATLDGTYQFAGDANYISALHFRYDPTNQTYLSFEQHVASQKAYAIFSVNPATRPSKFWNLILSDQPTDRFQIRTFTQLHTFQSWLSQPLESSQFTNVQAIQAMPHSSLQLYTTFQNQSLLAPPAKGYYGSPEHTYNPDHVFYGNLGVQSNELGRNKPLRLRYRYGIGMVDDGFMPLQYLGGVPYYRLYTHYFGITAYTPQIDLTHGTGTSTPKDLFFNAVVDKQRTWFSSPHYQDITNTTFSIGRVLDVPKSHVTAYMQYNVLNVGDYYHNGLQRQAYPIIVEQNGVFNPGYAAFQGFATYRTLSLGTVYTNGPDFAFTLVARQHTDFPRPVPGFFTLPPTDVFGRYIYVPYFGEPPYDITPELRVRVARHMMVDIARTYYFNFGNQRWSPHFVIQVTQ